MESLFATSVLNIKGQKLFLDDKPFFLQGLSFFNALYNPVFNQSDEERRKRLHYFKENGINTLRIWCQWDFNSPFNRWVDVGPSNTMYTEKGDIREESFSKLEKLIKAADDFGMVIEVVLFSHEKVPNLPVPILEKLAGLMTERLMPYRNIILQIWNEDSTEVIRFVEKIKSIDPERLVSNSFAYDINEPVAPDVIKYDKLNEEATAMLDIITPHTVRRGVDRFWEYAAEQIKYLMDKYKKPIIDDEPARTGTLDFGGIKGGTKPEQHIEQIKKVRACGAYHIYHHDMFQNGYNHPATPPQGIPDVSFSSFHRPVFEYLKANKTW